MININIRFSRSLCISVFCAAFFGYGSDFILAYTAALIHELAHAVVCVLMKIKIKSLVLGALGLKLEIDYVSDLKKRVIISSAGPFVSFFIFLVFSLISVVFWPAPVYYRFSFVNLCIALVNIIPVMPLDGGVIVKNILAIEYGIVPSYFFHKKIAVWFVSFMIVIEIILAFTGIMCASLYVITAFLCLTICMKKEFY